MRLAALVVPLLLALHAPVSAVVPDDAPIVEHVLREARESWTVGGILREQEGAAPRFLDIMELQPVVRGQWTVLTYMSHNGGIADFRGTARLSSEALGIEWTTPWNHDSGWFWLGEIHVDTRTFTGPVFDLTLVLEDPRGVVEHWRRDFAVLEADPCDGAAALFGSGGMKHVRPDESTRYGLMLCNGTTQPRTATIVLRDSTTGRPLVDALSLAGVALWTALDAGFGTGPAASPYSIRVEPGWYSGMHFVLEQAPGAVDLEPEAIVVWSAEDVDHVKGLDAVTYALGDDLARHALPGARAVA